ncbi:MAG TPA: hypothetical protein VLR91_05480 [Thermodesulfobacteriota bacterium]|nr:hypothetical protein [Thermodesulfobacteriota bacterium]
MQTQKKVKTVRFEESELSRIKSAALRLDLPESEVIRRAVSIGIMDLINGEDEDVVLRRRLADKSTDVDGETFLLSLKREFSL